MQVVHSGRTAGSCRTNAARYADRWSHDELVRALRYARHLAPLPAWARRLLAEDVTKAAA